MPELLLAVLFSLVALTGGGEEGAGAAADKLFPLLLAWACRLPLCWFGAPRFLNSGMPLLPSSTSACSTRLVVFLLRLEEDAGSCFSLVLLLRVAGVGVRLRLLVWSAARAFVPFAVPPFELALLAARLDFRSVSTEVELPVLLQLLLLLLALRLLPLASLFLLPLRLWLKLGDFLLPLGLLLAFKSFETLLRLWLRLADPPRLAALLLLWRSRLLLRRELLLLS